MSKSKGGWIKWRKDTATDPRIMATAEKLATLYEVSRRTPGGPEPLSNTQTIDFLCNAVTGALQKLWCLADEQIRPDDTLEMSSQSVDAVVRLEGFFATIPRQWVAELDDGRVVLPGYCEQNSLIVKKKRALQSHERVKRYRARNKCVTARVSPEVTGVTSDHVTTLHRVQDIDKDYLYRSVRNARGACPRAVRRPCALPADFSLTEARRAKALAKAPGCDVELWFDHFRNHHQARGSVFKDWDAAWRTWICQGVRFGYPRKQEAPGAANGLPVLNG